MTLKINTIKRLVIISRPIYWIPTLALYLWGLELAGSVKADLFTILGAVFFSFPENLIIFGLNDVADRESDLINPRKGGIDGAIIAKKEIKTVLVLSLTLASLFLLTLLIGGRYKAAAVAADIILFAYAYSFKPIRLKTIPIIDTLSNGFWIASVFLTGVYMSNPHISDSHLLERRVMVAFFAGCAFHALGTVLDYESDKSIGEKTVGLLLGKRLTTAIACFMLFVSFLYTPDSPTQQVFFGCTTLLSFLIIFYPNPKFISRLRLVFFYLIAILIPGMLAITHFNL